MAKKKGKAPSFPFYVRDWLSDPQLRQTTPAARGIWIDLLCFMWEAPKRGTLVGTLESYSRMLAIDTNDFEEFLHEIRTHKFGDVTLRNARVTPRITLRNRRMHRLMDRDENARKHNAERQQRHREKQRRNAGVTPEKDAPSSSSSSSSSSSLSSSPLSEGAKKEKDVTPAWNIQAVFEAWQTTTIDHDKMVSHETLTDDIRAAIAKAVSEHTDPAKIIKAVENYAAVLQGDEYRWSHAWPLELFLERGLSRFLDDAKPLKNYHHENTGGNDGNNSKDIGRSFTGAKDDADKFKRK